MMHALTTNEQDRLSALERYHVLDSDYEIEFDDITKLVSQLCNTPTSLITLLDESRQWFKAKVGFELPETPREHSFCRFAIAENELFQVSDASIDERFQTNPLVTGYPQIRFYAGMPLVTPDGYALGTLCVIDNQPRQSLTEEQIFALKTLAKQVITQLELRLHIFKFQQAYTELEAQKQKMLDSIHYGKRIQTAIQPTLSDIQRHLPESFIFLKPRDIVSGDFYFFTEDKYTGKLILAVGDCTGHGVPGAFMSMIGSALLSEIIKVFGITSPEEILFQLEVGIHKHLRQQETQNQDGMEIAICVIDKESEVLEFAGARHDLFIVQPSEEDGSFIASSIAGDKRSIGGFQRQNEEKFTKHRVPFDDATRMYLFSDGAPDQFGGPENRKLSKKALRSHLMAHAHLPFQEQGEILEQFLHEWMQHYKQTDDMLVFGFQCKLNTNNLRARIAQKRKQ